jgi:hypothetical protein
MIFAALRAAEFVRSAAKIPAKAENKGIKI